MPVVLGMTCSQVRDMEQTQRHDLPRERLLAQQAAIAGYHTDATYVDVARGVELPQLIHAFYTSSLFKAERAVLRLAGHRSSDEQAAALAAGDLDHFAVWKQEARSSHDLLMVDISGRTKSWLCTERIQNGSRLWFGTVVVPKQTLTGLRIPFLFRALMRPHLFYSRQLLRSAVRNLHKRLGRLV